MQPHRKKSWIITLLGFSLFLLLLFNVLGLMTFEPYRHYGRLTDHWTLYLSLFALTVLCIYFRDFLPRFKFIYISLILFILSYTLAEFINHNQILRENYIQFLLMISFILTIIMIQWNQKHIISFGIIASIIILAYTYHWVDDGLSFNRYLGFFTNPNVSGVFFFTLLYFQIVSFKDNKLLIRIIICISIAANLVLIYATTARSILLSLIVIVGSYVILKFSKQIFYYIFYIIMSLNLSFIFIYILLYNSRYASDVNQLSREFFNKSFFSGRENIWDPAIKYGLESPLIGHGISTKPIDFIENTHYVHVHNQYLQTFLDGGLVGLAIFSVFLFLIWRIYNQQIESYVVQWSASFFLGILVYQNTEMTLFHNLPSISLLHWLIIAIGVSYSIYLPIKKYDEIW